MQFTLVPHPRKPYNREVVRELIRAFEMTENSGHPAVVPNFANNLENALCGEHYMMTEELFDQISRWCHTGGGYVEGMAVMRAISVVVYGHVIQRFDQFDEVATAVGQHKCSVFLKSSGVISETDNAN